MNIALVFFTVMTAIDLPKAPEGTPVISLYEDSSLASIESDELDAPRLFLFTLPDATAPTPAILICPGGGYGHLAMAHEGYDVAQWLNSHGIAAVVLQYRIAPNRHPAPLQDAQQAMRLIRKNADEWNINPDRTGALGFSAGGHLVSTLGTHFSAIDGQETIASRPDFMILLYPVISMMPPIGHMGSRNNLIGTEAAPDLEQALSSHLQVNSDTPPTFLVHTSDDPGVPVENSLEFYMALLRVGVPAEMHLFETGRHGLGLGLENVAFQAWPELCIQWLRTRGMLED